MNMKNPIDLRINFHREGARHDSCMDVTIEAEDLLDFMKTVAPSSRVQCVESHTTGCVIWDRDNDGNFLDLLKIATAFSLL